VHRLRERSRWAHFRHGADIGICGIGETPGAAFEQAALALTAAICDPARVHPTTTMTVRCQAEDLDFLFLDWINSLVFEMATRRMLFSRFSVRIEGDRLTGEIGGEAIDIARHRPAVEVKGATLTELGVGRTPEGLWQARCVVDV
jgi:SHS2 domain-containing protein